jgi:hypothetical protein
MYSPVGCDINEAFRMSKRSRDRENPPLRVPLACVSFIHDPTGIRRGSRRPRVGKSDGVVIILKGSGGVTWWPTSEARYSPAKRTYR